MSHLRLVTTPPEPIVEPTDEDLWLENIARQVEAEARPLFAATWIWLLKRALDQDENEPGERTP